MFVTIEICATSKKGDGILETRYSNWERIDFQSERDARIYCQGVLSGLTYKYANAAVRMKIEGGKTEEFF